MNNIIPLNKIIAENKYFDDSDIKMNLSKIKILSNFTTNPLSEILRWKLRKFNINANIDVTNYDNIIQDSFSCEKFETIIILMDLANYFEGSQFKIELFDKKSLNDFFLKISEDIKLVLRNLRHNSLVLISSFASYAFTSYKFEYTNLDYLKDKLNLELRNNLYSNQHIIDFEKIISIQGLDNSYDARFFYLTKTLYKNNTYHLFSDRVCTFYSNKYSYTKKALIVDCDNTLWGGVLGEDGFENIQMSSDTPKGKVFADVQNIILNLAKKGIIIGLCSKNNFQDVQNVIKNHPDMKLKDDFISIKKINWNNKAENLVEISKELNINLDSIVFLDDSSFEIDLINSQLVQVKTLKVPDFIFDYPEFLVKNFNIFYNPHQTHEDLIRGKSYINESKRNIAKKNFKNIDEFLKSLNLKVTVNLNDKNNVKRISQMTLKTNQFNLTTKRYSENDIIKILNNKNFLTLSYKALDRFGDLGTVGLVILEKCNKNIMVDTFLMSCRAIGRNIEDAMFFSIYNLLKKKNFDKISSTYLKTNKNLQVENFYEKFKFKVLKIDKNFKTYEILIKHFRPNNLKHIEINYEK